jgi:SHS2 domain-containing protein
MSKKKFYEYIDHTADLGIKVYGKNLEGLFINIARAIFETQIEGKIEDKENINIEIKSESKQDLFIDWCREILYNFSVKGFIPKRYKISIDNFMLKASLYGDTFDTNKHKIKLEIKNPTYHNLRIEKTRKGYEASIIFDV